MRSRFRIVAAVGCAAALTLTACSSSSASKSPSSGTTSTTTTGATHSGEVDVLSAGSLQSLMQKAIIPRFHTATGYTESDFSAGSKDLAADITGKVKQGDVFVSAAVAPNATLQGAANGSWESWYATFATSELVLGYSPKSTFAADLKSKPWYDVVTMPGFRLGLTPPASDPKGVLAVQALDSTATAKKLPALKALGAKTSDQFPETNLETDVESGQIDAAFFYQAEANSAGIQTVPLTGVDLKADYTITVLNKAPHPAAAYAFVNYLLGAGGRAQMQKYGFTVVSPPTVSGSGVPEAVSTVIP